LTCVHQLFADQDNATPFNIQQQLSISKSILESISSINSKKRRIAIMFAEFEGTLVKWGTSVGLAIPKPIRDGMNLKAGDKIRILLRHNMICIQKVE
jgi:AbrB family looped-hinge helix DNA binding protein